MDSFAPFTFTGLRFLLGSLVLLPFVFLPGRRRALSRPGLLRDGLRAGAVLFAAASLQQLGLVDCEAGAAGLLTGLYVFFVPLLGRLGGEAVPARTWRLALLAVAGLALLSLRAGDLPRLAPGEGLVLLGAVAWALHLRVIDAALERQDALLLALLQFLVCGLLATGAGRLVETGHRPDFAAGWLPLLYGGLLSVGVAYTLQVIGQQRVRPALAALLLSLESLFAALGGAWLLGERLGLAGWTGALVLMLAVALAATGRAEGERLA